MIVTIIMMMLESNPIINKILIADKAIAGELTGKIEVVLMIY